MNPKKVFVREATGLVKDISLKDVVVYNSLASGTIALALAYSIAWIPAWFTGADAIVSLLLTSLLYIPVYVTYGLIVACFPRTSGEYVYVSRILNPGLGFAASFNVWFWNIFVLGISAYWVPVVAISPALTAIGLILNDSSLASLGAQFSTPTVSFIVAVTVVIAMAILAGFGTRTMMRLQNALFVIGAIGYVTLLAVLGSNTRADFINIFNAHFPSNTVSSIIAAATKAGVQLPYVMNWNQTILAFSVCQGVMGWIMWSQYVSGEIKRADSVKRQWMMFFAPWAIEVIAVGTGAYLTIRTIGYDFLAAIGTAWPLQTPPYVTFFGALLSQNAIVAAVIMFSMVAWILAGLSGPMMTFLTRLPFAWSFDRMFPEKFATISERYRAPVYTIVLVAIIGVLTDLLLSFYSSYFSIIFAGTVAGVLIFTTVPAILAAIVLPFKKKEMYDSSPAKAYEVKGVPLISVIGVVALLVQGLMAYTYIFAPFWGFAVGGGGIMLGVFVAGFVVYYIFRAYRKSQGVNVDLVYTMIPPE